MAHNLRLVKDLVDQASAAGAKVRFENILAKTYLSLLGFISSRGE
jgi:hypothetical protein